MFKINIWRIYPCLLLFIAAGFLPPSRLSAENLHASPLEGTGEYEFLFFKGEKKPEIDGLTARFRELDPELKQLNDELKKAEAEAAAGSKVTGKKAQRLEWSAIDGVTGYSVKLFDAKKNPLETKSTSENSLTVEFEPGEYFFQVAAVTKYKTGTYSRMTAFKISKGKPGAAAQAAEERAESLREKIRIQRSIRGEYLKTLRAAAVGTANATEAKADVSVPASAAIFLAVNKKTEPYAMSQVAVLPGRNLEVAARSAPQQSEGNGFLWGAGGVMGVQDTRLDFFRVGFGLEGFVRYDKPFLKYFYPQLKLMATYSGGKTAVYDAMLFANLYPGVYYPFEIGKGFSLLVSLSTGPNVFFVLSSVASSSVLQWGFMPALEAQYALNEKMSIYAGAGINLTYDSNLGSSGFFSSGSWLKFIPFSVGITRRF